MKKLVCALGAAALVGFGVQAALADGQPIHNGVGASSGAVIGSADVTTPSASDSLLNSDDVTAPCLFNDTVALRNYNGVHFSGDSSLNGGAILNECSSFGVTGYSPPNFLAFNCSSTLSNGGIPKLPERINLRIESSNVSLKLGSGTDTGIVNVVGRDTSGRHQRIRVRLTPELQTVTFTIPVKVIKLSSADVCTLVVDDISF